MVATSVSELRLLYQTISEILVIHMVGTELALVVDLVSALRPTDFDSDKSSRELEYFLGALVLLTISISPAPSLTWRE